MASNLICEKYEEDLFLSYTIGFTQLFDLDTGKIITIIGEHHNKESLPFSPEKRERFTRENKLRSPHEYILQTEMDTLLLTEIPPNESITNPRIPSINLQAVVKHPLQPVANKHNSQTKFSDLRPQIFGVPDKPGLYLDILVGNDKFSQLTYEEWYHIKGNILDLFQYYSKLETTPISLQEYTNKFVNILNKKIPELLKIQVDRENYRSLKEEDLKRGWEKVLVNIPILREYFIEIQQAVLDIVILSEIYFEKDFQNIIIIVGDNHRQKFVEYFTRYSKSKMLFNTVSTENVVNLKGSYTSKTLEACVKYFSQKRPIGHDFEEYQLRKKQLRKK